MISIQELKNLVFEWGLRDDVIEKDYVVGWLLWGIGTDPDLSRHWAFKGGTALKKCYIETWRFSEDLDFTVLPGGPDRPETIQPIIMRVLEKVHEESGIDFSIRSPLFKFREDHLYTEGRVYYKGPRNASKEAAVKLDISASEKIVRPTVLRKISHPYSDEFSPSTTVRCYAFEEVFAEKLRAMGERGRPRDLYDIVLLFRRRDLQSEPKLINSVLAKKCESKGVPIPTLDSVQNATTRGELVSEWKNMLGHQLLALPPFEQFWNELPEIFDWLDGKKEPARLASVAAGKDDDLKWSPPPTIWNWGAGIPLESIRFAAINHLCVELGYSGKSRLIEPYSLRRTKDGHLLLYAWKVESGAIRAYRVDRMESIKVSTEVFRPRYKIEFSSTGSIQANPIIKNSYRRG